METTASLNPKDVFPNLNNDLPPNRPRRSKILDPVRNLKTALIPEERVRQKLIRLMLEELGYPIGLIAVEKSIGSLNFSKMPIPRSLTKKRMDIVIFSPQALSSTIPLLLVECKSGAVNRRALLQVISYNRFVRSPVITLCNGDTCLTGMLDRRRQKFIFQKGIPSFKELLQLQEIHAHHR